LERDEQQEARNDVSEVGIRQQDDSGSDDDEKERGRADDQQAEADLGPGGLEIGTHEALCDDTIIWMAAGGKWRASNIFPHCGRVRTQLDAKEAPAAQLVRELVAGL